MLGQEMAERRGAGFLRTYDHKIQGFFYRH
jgi:hypothetical protein